MSEVGYECQVCKKEFSVILDPFDPPYRCPFCECCDIQKQIK